VLATLAAAGLLGASAALAAPPPNDNYLDSFTLGNCPPGAVAGQCLLPPNPVPVSQSADLTEATTQVDLFAPKGTGGGPENLTCNGVAFGHTVWWDFQPSQQGYVFVNAIGSGFLTVADVYTFTTQSALIGPSIGCSSNPTNDEFFVHVKRHQEYTLQIGGQGASAGPVNVNLVYYADRDGDTKFDINDSCPNIPGHGSKNGCPPKVSPVTSIATAPSGSGVRVAAFSVSQARGAKLTLRCRPSCGRESHRAGRKPVSFHSITRRTLRRGTVIELSATKRNAIGAFFRWRVRSGGIGSRTNLCLVPGSSKPRKRCR
jgi:hypothetical protein